MSFAAPFALLPSPEDGPAAWRLFERPRAVLCARRPGEVMPVLREAEAHAAAGGCAVGFVAYEAAPAFDTAMLTAPPSPALPLAWFGLFDSGRPLSLLEPATGWRLGPWRAALPAGAYCRRVARIRRMIRDGVCYQVNYCYPLTAPFAGDALAWFAALWAAQRSAHAAYLDLGVVQILSVSPERFLAVDGEWVESRPMKGTRPRAPRTVEDREVAAALHRAAKDRAENVMIVDMVRNDLGRLAEPGSVTVPSLFAVERYPTVWQMISTVRARSRAPLAELFAAAFPPASITGAPKIRAMRVIAQLETTPRGVYTGAVGVFGPGRRARFNVAIRTAWVDRRRGQAHYAVGGGIVWDSRPEDEYAETLSKAAVLAEAGRRFALLASLRVEDGRPVFLEDHLARLADSAAYFDFPCDAATVRRAVLEAAASARGPAKLRLTLDVHGRLGIDLAPLTSLDGAVVGLAAGPSDTRSPWHCHKTTAREVYRRCLPPGCDDALLWNADGGLTESTFANLVLKLEDGFYTPPAARGLLPGVWRKRLLEAGAIAERELFCADLARARALFLINSVRGWLRLQPDGPARWRLRETARPFSLDPNEVDDERSGIRARPALDG
ncbi:MAG: aminodeoxychorismate synthase, component I [Gammaproteobacteria bacterium]|nr:MAG: aminodeoxychorismate synthase, component I [Gammaproteobacteria bacterium]